MKREFTAGAYVIQNQKVLLIHHRKLGMWLPPGGHVDPNETPPEAARREVLEETGLEVELVRDEHVWVEEHNSVSIERPYMCLLEEIPAHGGEPAHQHIDFIYLAKVVGGELAHNLAESHGARWFSLEEVERLESEVETFSEIQQTIRKIFCSQLIEV